MLISSGKADVSLSQEGGNNPFVPVSPFLLFSHSMILHVGQFRFSFAVFKNLISTITGFAGGPI